MWSFEPWTHDTCHYCNSCSTSWNQLPENGCAWINFSPRLASIAIWQGFFFSHINFLLLLKIQVPEQSQAFPQKYHVFSGSWVCQKNMREGWSLEKLQNLKTWNMLRNLKHALENLCVITTRPWVEMVSMLHLKSPFLSLALEMLLINFPLYPLSLLFHLISCPIFHPKSSFKLQLDAMQPCPH